MRGLRIQRDRENEDNGQSDQVGVQVKAILCEDFW